MSRSKSLLKTDIDAGYRALEKTMQVKTIRRDPLQPLREHAAQVKCHLTVLEQQGIRKISPRVEVLWTELLALFEQVHAAIRDAGRKEPDHVEA